MQQVQEYFSTLKIFDLIFRWKKHITIAVVTSMLAAVIISSPWVIKPRYKSTAVIYPSNLSSYSTETPTEQMLQICRSNEIRDSIIKKFNLFEHYDIDTTSRFHRTKLIKKYNNFVFISKSEFESVEIIVIDTDPMMAKNMVQSIVDFLNKKIRSLHRQKIQESVFVLRKQIVQKRSQIDSLNSRLDTLRTKYKILDYNIQVKEATKAMVKDGNNPATKEVMKNLQRFGGEFLILGGTLSSYAGVLNKLQADYEIASRDLTKEFTYTNMVTSPEVPEKKIYPIRWLILLVTTIGSFILTICTIALLESFQFVNSKKE